MDADIAHDDPEQAMSILRGHLLERACVIAELRTALTKYEESEAACCPEDVGFPEYIASLNRQWTAALAKLADADIEAESLRARMQRPL